MEFTRSEFGEPLDIDLHLARHLAAKIILDHARSMMGFMSVVLGHSRTEVTERFYTDTDKMISQKLYLEILAEQRCRIRTDLPPLCWAMGRHDVAA
jgi:hypothetical protein